MEGPVRSRGAYRFSPGALSYQLRGALRLMVGSLGFLGFARICVSTSMCLSQQNMLAGGTALFREGEIPEVLTDLLIVTKGTVNSLSLFETFVSVHF